MDNPRREARNGGSAIPTATRSRIPHRIRGLFVAAWCYKLSAASTNDGVTSRTDTTAAGKASAAPPSSPIQAQSGSLCAAGAVSNCVGGSTTAVLDRKLKPCLSFRCGVAQTTGRISQTTISGSAFGRVPRLGSPTLSFAPGLGAATSPSTPCGGNPLSPDDAIPPV